MIEVETFLTELYVLADDFCKTQSLRAAPGPPAALSVSEVLTVAIFSQSSTFPSEAAAYRYVHRHVRPCFPTLPSRAQLNRQVRRHAASLTSFALHLGQQLSTGNERAFEVLDGTGIATRNHQRRGVGWLAGLADIGYCSRLDWYEGVRLLLAVTPSGAVTGWGIGPASTNDRVLAETFLAARTTPSPDLPCVGVPTSDCYVADMGFSGKRRQRHWARDLGVTVISAPQTGSKRAWPKQLKQWLAGIRQVIETVNHRLLERWGLSRERPHTLDGLQARLAAAVGLHNVCCWLNRQAGRGLLTTADLLDW